MNKITHLLYFPNVKNCGWLYFVLLTSLGRIGIYLQIGIAGIGHYPFAQYFPIIINILMYYSIVKYIYDFFQKGQDVNIEGMLMRYSASCIASLLGLRDGSNALFILTALVLLLVPYMAGSLHRIRKVFVLTSVIGVLTMVISVLTMVINHDAAAEHIAGKRFFYLEASNSFVQWFLFSILIFVRWRTEVDNAQEINRQQ